VISLPKADLYASSLPAVEEDEEGEEGPDAEIEVESPDPINTGAELVEESEQVPEFAGRPEEIQILDLHSENPIISYKGHTFSCNWAENIGTELLFTAHDPKYLLPTLRSLPDNVDLLAASSARLNSIHIRLSPKLEAQKETIPWDSDSDSELYDVLGTDKPELVIPVGREASKSRKEQAEFLEKIMDLKQRKGEDDTVTIIATKRLTNNAWRGQVKHKKDEERTGLKQIIRQGGPAVVEAKKRLDELRREEAERVRNEQARKRILNERERDKSSKRARAGMIRRPRGGLDRFRELQSYTEATTSTLDLRTNETTLSTPTPRSWDELQRGSYESEDAANEEDDMD
jgi:TFIIIC subunit triple barrel domain